MLILPETFSLSSFNNTKPNIEFSDINFTNGEVIEVLDNTIYDATITYSSHIARDAASNKALDVPFVDNGTTQKYPNGICWASAAASLIKYRLGSATTKSAITIRDEIVAEGYSPLNTELSTNMKTAIENYISGTITNTSTLSFSKIKTQIDNNKPIWSHWPRKGGGHSLVIRSYVVDSNGTQSIGFMDCNKKYYTAMTYGTSFSNGTYVYTWEYSVY